MPADILIFLHGFRSSPASYKAKQLKQYMAENASDQIQLIVPPLPMQPSLAMQMITQIIKEKLDAGHQVGLIGSSLGGLYATHISEHYAINCVLVNPVSADQTLKFDLKSYSNFHTVDHYFWQPADNDYLASLRRPVIINPHRFCVYLQQGDQTLNWQHADKLFKASQLFVEAGGDHGFQQFERHIKAMLAFLF